jgi:pimeloyl-ACP methyl ester carboxylesterase
VYARQVVALLDHLDLRQAVIGGISLGANVSLMTAARWPGRVRGLVIEIPVLERAMPAATAMFLPMLMAVRYTSPLLRGTAHATRRAPRTGLGPLDSALNAVSLPPRAITAVLHGLLVGPVAPTIDERRAITAPALVLAHRWDLIHPFNDAARLSEQLPNSRLVRARWPFELRMRPGHLVGEIAAFLDDLWAAPSVEPARARQQREQ